MNQTKDYIHKITQKLNNKQTNKQQTFKNKIRKGKGNERAMYAV